MSPRTAFLRLALAATLALPAAAQTVEQKHLIQMNGPYANSNTFMLDLARYGSSWAFFEGRAVEYNGSLAFTKGQMTDAQFAQDRTRITGFTSATLTRDYVRVLCPAQYVSGNPSQTWNLWNDADRDAVVANFRMLARQARLTGFKGILFDPEPYTIYGYNPWQYTNHSAPLWSLNASGQWVASHTFADTQARMQDMGARVMSAIEAEAPGTRVLFTQGLGFLSGLCYDNTGKALTAPVSATTLSSHAFGLLPAFIGGMASTTWKCRIVDMQEAVGYWAESEADFQAGNSFMYTTGPDLLLPPSTITAYRSYVHWGHMLFTDALMRYTSDNRYLSGWMLASERPLFMEAMAYWAMKNASGRGCGHAEVIVYTEKAMWGTTWGGTSVTYPPTQDIPNAFAAALNLIRTGQPAPDVSKIVADARYRRTNNIWPGN